MDDNPCLEEVPMPSFVPPPLAPDEPFRGECWPVTLENEGTVLEWISGQPIERA